MKSILTKNILALAIIALAFFGQQASAQVVDDFYLGDPYQLQSSLPYNNQYTPYGSNDQSAQIAQLLELVAQLQAQLYGSQSNSGFNSTNGYTFVDVSGNNSFNGYNYGSFNNFNNNDNEPQVETESARDIQDDSAELRGEVDMNDFRNGIVFFVYGQDEDMIEDVEDDYDEYSDVNDDEEDDDFEVVRVDSDLDDDDYYEEEVNNLEEDEEYFFVICVEYEDEDNDETLECGDVEDFDTDDNNSSSSDDEPEVETDQADDVQDDSAELRGSVDMNDFDGGIVFFVWGEDEDDVEEVEDENQYQDINENGEDLQKQSVDTDFDGNDNFELDVFSLDNNTDIYFSICVQYEDEDDDDIIECGNVRNFETDN